MPGSTFKTVTASAAVDSSAVDLQAPFLCTTAVKVGTYSVDCKNSQHLPRLTYQQAFAWSSNRVFGLTGLLLGFPNTRPINAWLDDAPPGPYPWTRPDASIKSSADVLVDYAHRFGFDRSIPFDLPAAKPRQTTVDGMDTRITGPDRLWPGRAASDAAPDGARRRRGRQDGRVPTPYLARDFHRPG